MALPTVRISIRGLMAAMAILALDLAAFRTLQRVGRWLPWEGQVLVAIVPSVNALVIGLALLVRQVERRGVGAPFLVGFQAVGWPAVAAVLIAKLGFEDQASRYQEWARMGLTEFWIDYVKWTGDFTLNSWREIQLGLAVFALGAPPLMLAMLGGWIAVQLKVAVVRGPEPGGRARAIPARHARAALVATVIVLAAGVWTAKIRGRWLVYHGHVRKAIADEPIARRHLEQALAQLRAFRQNPKTLYADPNQPLRILEDMVEIKRRWMVRSAALRKLYEPAARRPWLPIPPNPPLEPPFD